MLHWSLVRLAHCLLVIALNYVYYFEQINMMMMMMICVSAEDDAGRPPLHWLRRWTNHVLLIALSHNLRHPCIPPPIVGLTRPRIDPQLVVHGITQSTHLSSILTDDDVVTDIS